MDCDDRSWYIKQLKKGIHCYFWVFLEINRMWISHVRDDAVWNCQVWIMLTNPSFCHRGKMRANNKVYMDVTNFDRKTPIMITSWDGLSFCIAVLCMRKKHGLPTKSQRKGPVMQGFDGYHLEQTVECPVLTSMRDSYNTYYVRDIGSQQLR